jgi:hypothetical protein
VSVAIVGLGLVSPMGLTPRDHAFFVRAGALPPWPSPFLSAADEPVAVGRCPCIAGDAPIAERMIHLATMAIEEAMLATFESRGGSRIRAVLCTSASRPGLTSEHVQAVERGVGAQVPGSRATTRLGAAAVFDVLREADETLQRGDVQALLVVAVDSFVSIEALEDFVQKPPSPWRVAPPVPSEAAAALLVMTPTHARRTGQPVLATIDYAASAGGTASDENDEPVDGGAMATLLWQAPPKEALLSVFGQHAVDSLRAHEWDLAKARNKKRFDAMCTFVCPEKAIGSVGAAAGAVSLAYGVAALRHDTLRDPRTRRAPFGAWAISRDGVRGLAIGRVEP